VDLNIFRLVDLPQMWQFADLRIADHIFLGFADLQFADSIFFCGIKTSANPQIHSFYSYKYKPKVLSFKFKDGFWLLEQF
jgi:hypothetical protein